MASVDEICRMSWFLVEVEIEIKSKQTEINLNGTCEYFIIHSVDINDNDSGNMYVDGSVKFSHNQRLIEGKVILASEDRIYVEQEMQRLTGMTHLNMNGKFFLVQYSSLSKNVVHALISERDVVWSIEIQEDPSEVVIDNGQERHVAKVLRVHHDDKVLKKEFQYLKNWFIKKFFSEGNADPTNLKTEWMLVQYSVTSLHTIYAIYNERDACWPNRNLYQDIVTYLIDGQTMYQGIILKKSQNVEELNNCLKFIKESSLNLYNFKRIDETTV